MHEEEIIELSEREIEKIERVEEAVATRERAIAEKERHQKFRVLFQRTAREQLPFVVYVVYMGALSLFAVNNILTLSGQKIWFGGGIFITALIVPLVVLWVGTRYTSSKENSQITESS
jgi:hypothetical protein